MALAMSVYSAAQGGVIAVTTAAAREYGSSASAPMRSVPGMIPTEGRLGSSVTQHISELAREIPRAGAWAEPHEVVRLASFLESNRTSFISGAIIPVDRACSCLLF